MFKTLTLDEAQQLQTGGMIVEEGKFFRFISTDTKDVKPSDHIDTLLPRTLPIDQNGNVITVGIFNNVHSYELEHDLVGAEIILCTGKFIRATNENEHSIFECRHPKDSEDAAVYAIREHRNHYFERDVDVANETFGTKYGDVWNCQYDFVSASEYWVKNVWVLPIDGPIAPICRYLSILTDHDIDEGDTAIRLRAEDERDYQAYKARYRADLERSGLIDRFRWACINVRRADIDINATLELKDDYVEFTGPDGEVSYIRYDHNCVDVVWEIVRTLEELDSRTAMAQRLHPVSRAAIILGGDLPS